MLACCEEKMEGVREVLEDRLTFRLFLYDGAQLIAERSFLEAHALRMQEHVAALVAGHIWQHDALIFTARHAPDASVPPHIGGHVRFGDNVEDEWLCIALLFSITSEFPNTIAQLSDTDGEVLLIEAALALPRWLEPDTSENRVLLARGMLHIVPPPAAAGALAAHLVSLPAKPTEPSLAQALADPSLPQALAIVRASLLAAEAHKGAIWTEASPEIQQILRRRIHGYPAAAIAGARHRSWCVVPQGVARVLRQRPQLLSPAVRCFYEREPLDLKAAAAMHKFGYALKGKQIGHLCVSICTFVLVKQTN